MAFQALVVSFALIFIGLYGGSYGISKVAIPLLSDLKAPLVANLDVTELNRIITNYINSEVEQKVKESMASEMDRLLNAKSAKFINLFETRVNSMKSEMKGIVNEAVTSVQEDTDKELGSLSAMIQNIHTELKNTTSEVERLLYQKNNRIGFTACEAGVISKGMVAFSQFKAIYGSGTYATYKNGVFTPSIPGYYFMVVNILGKGYNGAYINRNDEKLSVAWFNHPAGNGYRTGTTSAFLKLNTTDEITVQLFRAGSVDHSSCLTIAKF